MTWWFSRFFKALLVIGTGALAGEALARMAHVNMALPWVGAAAGLAVAVVLDLRQASKVLAWLQGKAAQPAPAGQGFWGELAYRIERIVRQRETLVGEERDRLAQFLTAIDASPNGVTLIDVSDAVTWCNAAASDHFAIHPVRDRLQRITNLVRAPAFVDGLASAEESMTFMAPGGQRKLSVIVRPYGKGSRILLSNDITEAERADGVRTHFVSNVSHEIRTPLTVLSGFLESLSTLDLGDDERKRVLFLMRQQADRMQTLVADLLTLAQLEGSPRPTVDHWMDLDSVWQQLRSDALALSAGRHTIDFDVAGGLQMAGRRNEFVSLVINLLSNAIRYTPAGGRIDLIWRVNHGRGELTVRDTGVGIAPEHLPRITERFYRVDGSRSRETGGTGLGLAIVKHVAQRHGGELLIDSVPGKGSTFRVDIPAARIRLRTEADGVSLPASASV